MCVVQGWISITISVVSWLPRQILANGVMKEESKATLLHCFFLHSAAMQPWGDPAKVLVETQPTPESSAVTPVSHFLAQTHMFSCWSPPIANISKWFSLSLWNQGSCRGVPPHVTTVWSGTWALLLAAMAMLPLLNQSNRLKQQERHAKLHEMSWQMKKGNQIPVRLQIR